MTIPAIPETRMGRLAFVAEALGVSPPERLPADLLDADSAPAKAVLTFCKENGANLDFIYLGDVAILVRYTAPSHFAPHICSRPIWKPPAQCWKNWWDFWNAKNGNRFPLPDLHLVKARGTARRRTSSFPGQKIPVR